MCHTVLGCPLSSLTLHMTARKFGFAMQLQASTVGTQAVLCLAACLHYLKRSRLRRFRPPLITDENSVLLAQLHCRIQIIDPQALRIYCRILSAKTIFVLWRIRSRALALWRLSGRSDDPCSHGPAKLVLRSKLGCKVYRGLEAGRRADLRTA
jgi:hypothetical protein